MICVLGLATRALAPLAWELAADLDARGDDWAGIAKRDLKRYYALLQAARHEVLQANISPKVALEICNRVANEYPLGPTPTRGGYSVAVHFVSRADTAH